MKKHFAPLRRIFGILGDALDLYINKEHKKESLEYIPSSEVNDDGSRRKEEEIADVEDYVDVDFIIPELPQGEKLTINIHSTWGDRHYVGLNGIEIFSKTGQPVAIKKVSSRPGF